MFFPNDLNSQESLLFLESHCHCHELFYLSVTSPLLFYFNSSVYMHFSGQENSFGWRSTSCFLVVKEEVTTFTPFLMLAIVLLFDITSIVQL